MAIEISGLVNWLKGWFYDKSEVYKKEETYSKTEVNNALSNKLNSNLVTANKMLVTGNTGDVELADKIDISGKIDTAGTGLSKSGTTVYHNDHMQYAQSTPIFNKFSYDKQGHITGTANVLGDDLPSHTHSKVNITDFEHNHIATDVKDTNAHSNIGTSASATQGAINTAIDTAIGNLQSIKAIEVVSTKPTASADTMNKLYIVAETVSGVQKVNVYYTKQTGSTYEWVKLDDNILDELSIDWSEIENKPTTFTPSPHTHGNITNDGKIGSSSGKLVVTGTDGILGATSNILTDQVKYTNNETLTSVIGDIYDDIDDMEIAIGGAIITSISLVPKSTDANGKIIFYTGDEPT